MSASVAPFCPGTLASLKGAGGTLLALPNETVALSEEAAHLLADYLLVIRAYFRPRKQKAVVGRLHGRICQHLRQQQRHCAGPLPRNVVADLIAHLGCAADWHRSSAGSRAR